MGKDYYALLDVPKTANDDELKKAYRKMALKWHPDRHKGSDKEDSEKKFKDISEAYEVLSDKQKRSIYDQFGEEALKNGMPAPNSNGQGAGASPFFNFPGGSTGGNGGAQTFTFSSNMPGSSFGGFTPSNPEDIFQQIFMDGFGGFMGSSSAGPKPGRPKARSRTQDFSSFGTGPSVKSKEDIVRTLPVSLSDLYSGVTKKLKVTRNILDQAGKINQSQKILQIDVKPGWKSGTKVRFSGEGDDLGNGPQDIVILIEEKSDSVFKRDKDNLLITLNLTLKESLCGFKKTITTLDNRTLDVENLTNVVRPGQESRITGEGMPISKVPNSKGDMIVTYNVEFPRSLSHDQKEKLRNVLN
ncbi:hypothetical protein BB561_002850 [Smittium simulii]|uniref:J domain-containing protein n=1 Tax=Smittium simulii TaxID=133385 RepID=A0A2T9YNU4_9FUNG|nr:hypothetical protein BB561_002850 [Smittium simulii]